MFGSPSAGDPTPYPRPGIVASRWEGEAFRTSSRLPFSGIVYPVPGLGRVGSHTAAHRGDRLAPGRRIGLSTVLLGLPKRLTGATGCSS